MTSQRNTFCLTLPLTLEECDVLCQERSCSSIQTANEYIFAGLPLDLDSVPLLEGQGARLRYDRVAACLGHSDDALTVKVYTRFPTVLYVL